MSIERLTRGKSSLSRIRVSSPASVKVSSPASIRVSSCNPPPCFPSFRRQLLLRHRGCNGGRSNYRRWAELLANSGCTFSSVVRNESAGRKPRLQPLLVMVDNIIVDAWRWCPSSCKCCYAKMQTRECRNRALLFQRSCNGKWCLRVAIVSVDDDGAVAMGDEHDGG